MTGSLRTTTATTTKELQLAPSVTTRPSLRGIGSPSRGLPLLPIPRDDAEENELYRLHLRPRHPFHSVLKGDLDSAAASSWAGGGGKFQQQPQRRPPRWPPRLCGTLQHRRQAPAAASRRPVVGRPAPPSWWPVERLLERARPSHKSWVRCGGGTAVAKVMGMYARIFGAPSPSPTTTGDI